MAQYIPKINLPVEAVEHAKWLQKARLEQDKFNEEVRAFMARAGKGTSTGARQVANVNVQAQQTAESVSTLRGLPDGDEDNLVLRTRASGKAFWSGEIIDQISCYEVGLGTGSSYAYAFAGSSNDETLLPLPVISPDEKTMDRIQTANFDEFPVHLELALYPTSDLEEFEVWLPSYENDFGTTTPFWTFHLINTSSVHRARVTIIGTGLIYAGTNVPVLGDLNVWDLDPEFEGAWVIHQSHRAYGVNAATPLAGPDNFLFGGVPENIVVDKFFTENVRGRTQMLPFSKSGGLSTGVLPQTYYNDTTSKQYVTFARATVGTAPTGADITVDIQVDGVTAFTTTIVATETTGTAAPAAQPWPVNTGVDFFTVDLPPGSYVTVDVTQVGSTIAGSDLTVQVWAG